MAVMTTTEHQTQPVPSSEKMALDLDINGTTKRDETNLDFEIPKPSVIPDFDPPPPLLDSIQRNNEAVAANNDRIMEGALLTDSIRENHAPSSTIDVKTLEVNKLLEGEKEISSPNTKITTSLAIAQTSSVDTSLIDSNFETATSTTVPPIVESQESDLRESTLPVSEVEAAEIHAIKHAMDLHADPELANGLVNTTGNEIIERERSDDNTQVTNMDESAVADNSNSQGDSAIVTDDARIQNNEQSEVGASHSTSASSPMEGESQKTHNIENLQIDESASQMAEQQQLDLATSAESAADVQMTDPDNAKADVDMDDLFGDTAPQSSGTKVAREREEDADMDAPDAKRVKVDGDVNGDAVEDENDPLGLSRTITPEIQKALRTSIQSARKGKVSEGFRKSVAESFPTLAEPYAAMIESPMDISLLEQKLQDGQYQTIGDYKHDVDLIYNNSVQFNSADSPYSHNAQNLQQYLTKRIPAVGYVPPAPKTKAKSSRKSTPNRDIAAARRPSRAINHVSPKAKAETFPLDPISQTPVIRRDSTLNNDRPKREIHPPKNKDIFTQAAPKTNRKKNALEMRFCEHVLQEVVKPRHYAMNQFFLQPVDPIALGIPTYSSVIKKPMDLSTMQQKLNNGLYANAATFESDFKLMLNNCFQFNAPENMVHQKGRDMERFFQNEWAKKQRWMQANGPTREAQLSPESEDDQSEEEEDAEAPPTNSIPVEDRNALSDKLVEEQAKLIELVTKSAAKQMITLQTTIVDMCKAQLKELDDMIAASKKATVTKKTKAPAKSAKRAPPPPPAPSKKPKKASKPTRYIGHREKEIISQGIGQLAEKEMQMVITWIRQDVPGLEQVEDNEMELDIDAVSDQCLNRLYDLVIKHVPHIVDTFTPAPSEDPPRTAAPAQKPKKKNKPMGKSEQESKIAQLKQVVMGGAAGGGGGQRYDDGNAGGKVMPSIEHAEDESSGDEEDSESEED